MKYRFRVVDSVNETVTYHDNLQDAVDAYNAAPKEETPGALFSHRRRSLAIEMFADDEQEHELYIDDNDNYMNLISYPFIMQHDYTSDILDFDFAREKLLYHVNTDQQLDTTFTVNRLFDKWNNDGTGDIFDELKVPYSDESALGLSNMLRKYSETYGIDHITDNVLVTFAIIDALNYLVAFEPDKLSQIEVDTHVSLLDDIKRYNAVREVSGEVYNTYK